MLYWLHVNITWRKQNKQNKKTQPLCLGCITGGLDQNLCPWDQKWELLFDMVWLLPLRGFLGSLSSNCIGYLTVSAPKPSSWLEFSSFCFFYPPPRTHTLTSLVCVHRCHPLTEPSPDLPVVSPWSLQLLHPFLSLHPPFLFLIAVTIPNTLVFQFSYLFTLFLPL